MVGVMTIDQAVKATFVCKIDETQQEVTSRDLRSEVLGIGDLGLMGRGFLLCRKHGKQGLSLRDVAVLLYYAVALGPQRDGKKKPAMNVKKMVEGWTEWLAVYSTAHDKDDIDQIEHDIDDLLAPLLTAPIKQIKQFYGELLDSLKNDKRIPFFVWGMFYGWGEVVLKDAHADEAIIKLKTRLANDIVNLCKQDDRVTEDIFKAMAGALQWRSEESLTEIKSEIEAGVRPRVKGRQSCLFLVAKRRGGKEKVVML
jgi:hypothetical protein